MGEFPNAFSSPNPSPGTHHDFRAVSQVILEYSGGMGASPAQADNNLVYPGQEFGLPGQERFEDQGPFWFLKQPLNSIDVGLRWGFASCPVCLHVW